LFAEVLGLLEATAALDDLVAEIATTHRVVVSDLVAYGGDDLQGQAHAVFHGSAIAVGASVGSRQERRHRVCVGEV